MPGGERAVGQRGGHGRQRHRLLGDPALGRLGDQVALRLERLLVGLRADEHALAARLAGGLDHQLVHVLVHVGELLGVGQQPGGEVVEDRLLAQVEADHLRHVVVDRLVVGHAGAHRVGDRHVAGAVGAHQARHAQQRVGAELERVHEVVVDAPVDRVHPRQAARGAHVAERVAHHEVRGLHQLHAHLAGQEGVLEVGAVGRPRGPDDHHRVLAAAGRGRRERVEQQLRVVAHRPHVVAREQLGQQAAHRDPVLEHVGDPRRRAHVVLEHLPAPVGVADEVAAGHVAPDAAGRPDAVRRPGEGRAGDHELPGHDALADDLAAVVDVLDEQVQRPHALGQAALDRAPLVGRQDARHQVERERPVARLALGGRGVEGDALLDEDRVAALSRGPQAVAPQALDAGREGRRGRPRGGACLEQLVEESGKGRVGAQAPGVLPSLRATRSWRKSKMRSRSRRTSARWASSPSGPSGSA